MNSNRPILLIEDDKVDAMTVERAFKDNEITNKLNVVGNGEEALKTLKDSKIEKPCIILLDLNMPKMNGIEFLRRIKNDKYLKSIPVVILTTSSEDQDRIDCFHLGASGYILKPVDYKDFVIAVRTINQYWSLSLLPGDV